MIATILNILSSVFSILKKLIPSREFKAGKKAAQKDVMEEILEDVRLAEVLRNSPDSKHARRVLDKYRRKDPNE